MYFTIVSDYVDYNDRKYVVPPVTEMFSSFNLLKIQWKRGGTGTGMTTQKLMMVPNQCRLELELSWRNYVLESSQGTETCCDQKHLRTLPSLVLALSAGCFSLSFASPPPLFTLCFPLCFLICLHPTSARSPHSHCSASGGSKTRFLFLNFYFFKIMYLSYMA